MNTLGHKFIFKVNNSPFEYLDAIEICKKSGFYFCKICNMDVYYYSGDDKIVYICKKFPTCLDISCEEMIIKKLLE